jgi:hypothetical protein
MKRKARVRNRKKKFVGRRKRWESFLPLINKVKTAKR